MPLFVLYALDKPTGLDIRKAVRPEHLEWIKSQGSAVRLAGPLLSTDDTPKGSLLILECENHEAAKRLAADDPYATHGLFETVTITPWREVVNHF